MVSRNFNLRVAASVAGCFATLASLTACGGGSADPASSAATTTSVPAATTTSEEATTTTVLATTTTTAPIVFTLRNDGLGPFDFGADPAAVIAGLTERFGAPVSDTTADYPEPTNGGAFHDVEFTHNFISQFGRTVCWTFGMCVNFGGVDSATTSFLGWRYEGDTASTLSTDTALTIGSRLSDHPELVEPLHPCFAGMDGRYGVYDGESWYGEPTIIVTYRSEGIPFDDEPGDVSGSTYTIPPPDVTFVKRLRAGQNPSPLDNYCG